MIDIDDMRERHANSIRNTATGRALGLALEELENMREQEKMERVQPASDSDQACPACSMSPREFQELMLDTIKGCCDLPDQGYTRVQVTLEVGLPPFVSVDFLLRDKS